MLDFTNYGLKSNKMQSAHVKNNYNYAVYKSKSLEIINELCD